MQKRSVCEYLFSIIFITLFFIAAIINFPLLSAKAQMQELSEIQNNIFFLSHKNAAITPATFINDRYIDDEQAEFFFDALKTEPYVEADKDYPFTLIDHFSLDSDLVILYDYDCIFKIYPAKAYLSRHNISIADYTNQKSPPEFFLRAINVKEPFHHDQVKAVTLTLNNYEVEKNEYIHETSFTSVANCSPASYMIDAYVRVISGNFTVWVGETYSPKYKRPTKPCQSCLPKSSCSQPEAFPIVKWIPGFNKCAPKNPRPKSNCVIYPKNLKPKASLNTKPPCITCK
jgi:hypothetical protein